MTGFLQQWLWGIHRRDARTRSGRLTAFRENVEASDRRRRPRPRIGRSHGQKASPSTAFGYRSKVLRPGSFRSSTLLDFRSPQRESWNLCVINAFLWNRSRRVCRLGITLRPSVYAGSRQTRPPVLLLFRSHRSSSRVVRLSLGRFILDLLGIPVVSFDNPENPMLINFPPYSLVSASLIRFVATRKSRPSLQRAPSPAANFASALVIYRPPSPSRIWHSERPLKIEVVIDFSTAPLASRLAPVVPAAKPAAQPRAPAGAAR